MRDPDERQPMRFSNQSIEDRIPPDHPLRAIRKLVDPLLVELSSRLQALDATTGRPSIPPEHLLRALLLQVLYTIRSERQLMEQLEYNLLYRWFVGLTSDDAAWVPSIFAMYRDRLLAGDLAGGFIRAALALADRHRLLSPDYFTVDGALLGAWAGHRSFRPIDAPLPPAGRNPGVHFRGERRSSPSMPRREGVARLTAREEHILALLAEGLSNKAIGYRLGIELGTVKNHVHNTMAKLSVTRRRDAAAIVRSVTTHREL